MWGPLCWDGGRRAGSAGGCGARVCEVVRQVVSAGQRVGRGQRWWGWFGGGLADGGLMWRCRYHPMCLGLLPFQTRVQKTYICPYCSALSSGVLSLHEDAYSEVRGDFVVWLGLVGSGQSVVSRRWVWAKSGCRWRGV